MKTFIVDSFTNQMFKGNPAGVCLLNKKIEDRIMLSIAQELNLSETAFVQKTDKKNTYTIRYFSPKMEIPLCGHATLASAKIIFEQTNLDQIDFITIQDLVLSIEQKDHQIIMEFPIYETKPAQVPPALLEALGLSSILNAAYNQETKILLLEISSSAILASLRPDFNALYHSHNSINGVLVTALSQEKEYDFHSRYFWPWSGTNEDPVTGGTHTFLTKYWADRLGKTKLKSFQSSSRTGFMDLEILDPQKFLIKGEAVIVFEGELKV